MERAHSAFATGQAFARRSCIVRPLLCSSLPLQLPVPFGLWFCCRRRKFPQLGRTAALAAANGLTRRVRLSSAQLRLVPILVLGLLLSGPELRLAGRRQQYGKLGDARRPWLDNNRGRRVGGALVKTADAGLAESTEKAIANNSRHSGSGAGAADIFRPQGDISFCS